MRLHSAEAGQKQLQKLKKVTKCITQVLISISKSQRVYDILEGTPTFMNTIRLFTNGWEPTAYVYNHDHLDRPHDYSSHAVPMS